MNLLSVTIAAALGGVGAQQVLAQQTGLDEIVVTATRRAVNLQDAPVAVTAYTGEALDNQNIENVQDLTAVVPNVLIRGGMGGTSGTSINMRGIPNVGTYVDDVWQVSGAGLLQRQFVELDRVEVLRGPQGTLYGRDSTGGSIHLYTKKPSTEFDSDIKLGIGDFDRRDASVSVDVPFTKNLLSKWTLASYSKDGYVHSLTTGRNAGDLDDKVTRGDLYWSPTDKLNVRYIHQEDDQTSTTARIQNFINYGVAYQKGYQVGLAEAYDIASRAIGGPGFSPESYVAGWPGGELGKYESRLSSRTPDRQNLTQDTLNVNYDISDKISLKYVYGNTRIDTSGYTDWGGSAYNFFVNYDLNRTDFDSHELQLSGNEGRIHWTGGVFNWNQKTRTRGVEWSMADWVQSVPAGINRVYDYNSVLNSPACQMTPADRGVTFPGNVWPFPCNAAGGFGWVGIFAGTNSSNGIDGSDRSLGSEQDGTAYFGEVTFDITKKWDLTVGARHHRQTNTSYTRDLPAGYALGTTEKRPIALDTEFADFSSALAAPIDPSSIQDVTFSKSTYRFSTSYHFTDNIMGYVGYSEGFNSGGFATIVDSLGPLTYFYDPETIKNHEIGLRSDLADGRLRLNITYFDTDWEDIQLATSVVDRVTHLPITETATTNAAAGNANGVELEVTYAPNMHWLLGANLGFLDTKYTDVALTAQITKSTEFGGAPDQTYNLSAQYTWDFNGGGALVARVGANYWGRYWRSQVPSYREDAYGSDTTAGDFWMSTARLAFTPASGKYELALWGNNLNNAYNVNSGFMDYIWQFDFAGVDAPREIGLTMNVKF
jgi:iron complex outermembrane receptor protein